MPSVKRSEYQPASRRPIADAFRATATGAVQLCVWANIHPDAISYASIAASALAGFSFMGGAGTPWLLVVGTAFCYLRLWLNMLDGMVALASGKASLRGEILNDLPDRISDVLIFVGLAHGHLCNPFLAYWVAIFALLTAYVGTFGQAVAKKREFGGLMSKPWRMVMLHIGAWATFGCLQSGHGVQLGQLSILDWTCLLIIIGCVQTIWVRLAQTLRRLAAQGHDS